MWAKQSTAATLIVGPILDSAGAEYASAVIGDLSISKNGGTLTALAAAATLTHIANGQYTLVTTTGNLDTLGRAQITCNKSTYQMPAVNLMVVPAMVFDSMVLGTDVLQADVTQLLGTAWLTPAVAGTPDVNTKTIATDAINANAIAADAVTEIQAGLATSTLLTTVAGYLDTEIAAILADTNELQTDWANGGRLDLILDARASQTSVDTIDGIVDAILVDTAEIGAAGAGLTALATQASVTAIDDLLDTEMPALTTAVADLPTNAELATAITTSLTTALTEGYRATNATGSVRDLLYEILQSISEFTISGTTKTVKKLDGSTTAKTYTLNDATTPTGITETT